MPGYGESSYRGQFLDGFGYYWAPNEFWDSKLTTSLADRQGLTLRLTNNYRKRYGFSGGIHLETKQHFLSSLAKQDRDLLELGQNVKRLCGALESYPSNAQQPNIPSQRKILQ